ncbi:ras-responsive element-binding protein 1 [Galleria mellonella]|uniref:Ras-responsive element-binding protein 1 n=1 Tax=Galleria mellonella TaxID=7137 RepID=A0A6J1WBH4_GALME|nr:ras-responsive element-binding protein 1 [Galleria mellonella]
MQGAASAPAPPAAEPPSSQQTKTEEVITQAKVETDKEMDRMVDRQEIRTARTTSIDSDNRSDRSEEDDLRKARKRAASTSPCPSSLDKRITRYECPKCRQRFDSANAYDIHRFTAHGDDTKTGFDDLTLIDFSSKKFPEIAREMTERNSRISISEQRYRCDVCSINFPCRQALDIHKKSCSGSTRIPTPDRDRREDFFANLNLRNRSFGIPDTLTPPIDRFTAKYDDGHLTNGMRHIDAARDLADIQSILNVTSAGSLLERLTGTRVPLESTVLTPPDTVVKEREQEETQDNFAAEFRRMKLRGEFPCRLCPAKFPNLRALKGHNRVHLNGTGAGPYQCNMCPHASLDKAALVRHMRTHNGDRPYECAVCNYAFTTKANCERHLRNRHAKVTREDVKRSIIYHPSEDPNNDEVNSKLSRDEVKRSLAFHTPEVERRTENTGRDTPLSHFTPNFINDRHPVQSLTSKSLSDASLVTRENEQPLPRIKVKGIGQLTQIPEYRSPELTTYKSNDVQTDAYDEAPVDLSTNDNNSCDVLDLSKKKRDVDDECKTLTRPSFEPDPATTVLEKSRLFSWANAHTQRLIENSLPKIDPAFYTTQLSQLYASTVPGLAGLPLAPSFSISPYFLQPSLFPHPTDSQEVVEMKQRIQKEIIRGLSMSGGRLVANDQDIQPKQEPEEEEQKPTQAVSPLPSPQSESPRPLANNIVPQSEPVKLVIKNGILMPKQKQRRYRTERPFSCSQCSARFTLRSNMERHVKQQHPQHWSVRRPTTRAPPPYPTPDSLADRVKYALLTRQLERPLQQSERSPIRRDSDEVADNEEDEDDTLVIDEEPDVNNKPDEHSAAHRAAAEILMASRQQELNKDFDLKIAGNFINKTSATPEKNDSGTNSINVTGQDSLPIPVVPTRSDEEEDEEGLVASTSEGNNSGSDENKSESDTGNQPPKKKSAYSLAPNRVSCPYCHRKFPWSSSLRRHVLTHTGQKPFKCPHCTLLFTTKSNCDRHLLRKHGGSARAVLAEPIPDTVSPPQHINDIRTVPERPFKCASCPTSTFSSLETLKKHMSSRHGTGDSQPGSPNPEINEDIPDGGLVFKCHLCESSFGDRGGALNHLATVHSMEYEQLVSKGALDAASDRSESADDDDRGKFPDHANRKVVCAFCVRRFWSAEDLRRHMRTHSGERPFACDLCHRKFTLKHSMLRHRKKHRDEITDDEEVSPPNTPIETDNLTNGYRYRDDEGSGCEIPSNVNNNNSPPAAPYDKKLKLDMTSRKYSSDAENDGENGSDLIGKLLGIPDKTIINKLLSSADEAAKFLGVNK